MSTYRALKGYSVKSITSDPANPNEGQVWYNSTAKTIKVQPLISAWSSGGAMNETRHAGIGFGTATAAVSAGGYNPSTGFLGVSEEYDGSSWTVGNDLGTQRYTGTGTGILTAGLAIGGNFPSGNANLNVESYDGTSYTEGPNISTGHGYGWGVGTQAASIMAGGLSDPSPVTTTANAESWDGSSWTEGPNINTVRYGKQGFGTATAAVLCGGTGAQTATEEWNNTAWSTVEALPGNRTDGSGSGILTDGMVFNGNPGALTTSLKYDGTNWAAAPSLTVGRANCNRGLTIGNTRSSIQYASGPGAPKMTVTEEYAEAAATRTVDVS